MTDIVTPEKRKQMMAGIRSKNTRPELIIRKALHKEGFRYRLHHKALPGKPDLVFSKYNAVVLVNGCFWHGHECHMFKWPKSRAEFWREKINGNKTRDALNHSKLIDQGWRVLTIRECALKGKYRLPLESVVDFSSSWLHSNNSCASVSGTDTGGIIGGERVT